MIKDESKEDYEMFYSLNKHPSFNSLTSSNKIELLELINKTKLNAEKGHWLINNSELELVLPEFANGSFSNVYDCNWRGTKIALKKPKNNKITNFVEFLKEIDVWSSLRHPNLVQFLGISFNDNYDEVSILMEKIEGTNLKDYIKKPNGSLSYTKKKHIIYELIKIFNFLHKCNPPIIYRDLKPENILITKDCTLKLADFGLSKYYTVDVCGNYIMTGGTGTLRYMAPEVYLHEPYTLKVDIYSLGMIMYYIITDERPFNNYDTTLMDNYFRTSDLIFSTSKIKNKEIRALVNKCIDKDPYNRLDINELQKEWNEIFTGDNKNCIIS
tara:strand:- start:93 stop:1073 length:981 start_codon:yes stop_codon:yes gene_type:complete